MTNPAKPAPIRPASRPKSPPREATTPPAATPTHPEGRATTGPDRPVTLGVVTGAHGIRGEVRVKVFADDFAAHRRFNGGALELLGWRDGIARFAGIADRTAAEAMRGTELTVPRSSLPPLGEGEYYHVDLIGLAATTPRGDALGRVVAVENYGASDVVEIERPDGKRFLVPMIPAAVPAWDEATITIEPGFVE